MSKPMTKIKKSTGVGTKFETTGVLTIDDNGVIFVENEAEGIVEPHLALSALDLHNQVVTIKVERKEEEEILDYTDLV
jgi:hypothetical protein